jgi:uncharacterized DUF497 family protein
MEFEWNPVKAARNKEKHGVSFELARFVFLDPCRIEDFDAREDYGEDRWITVGRVDSGLMLSVTYTVRRHEVYRIISARKADANERRKYVQVFPGR